ncbi:hypothetical protein TSUD_227420 [Trifolium subterraneum]|uniref:Histone deacetylase interacting domain-containing protein n=1 Tax=Trifolium subterraneum TaxID=3900 RepID=A0A2Z6MTH7_TRISU|nr:hypothetical protein TSUD_227420 [Trifolium subterraneum]
MTNSIYDALALISAVKSVFKDDNGEKYETFLEVLKDFKAGKIDRRDVKYRVYELFKGHQDLILRFNKFMPTQYEIKLPMDHDDDKPQGRQLETNDAFAFLKKVKDAFQGKNREKYDEFLEILKDFKAQRIHTSIVVERVKEMFKGHADLISGFNVFLPNTFQLQLDTGRQSETEDASAFIEKVKDVFEVKNKEKYDEFLEILKDSKTGRIDRSVAVERVKEMFEGHTDLILGFNAFLPNTLQIQLHTG